MDIPSTAEPLSRFRTFDAPPTGFDPRKAEPRLLRQYGFPRRPDAAKEPVLSGLWERALARAPNLRMIKAELAVDPVTGSRHRRRSSSSDFSPSGWASMTVQTASLGFSPFQPANTVFAEWVVPTIYPVAGDATSALTVGFWVGLDGSDPTSYELLQAGTAATITGNSVSYWAWTEWFTGEYQTPSVKVTNFAIQPGDQVSFLVCAPQPGQGFVSMMNQRTQQATSVGVPAPGSDITSVGSRAIWAVEGISTDLPDFSPLVFTNITAGTQSHAFNLSPDGGTGNITNGSGTVLAQAFVASPTTGLVTWQGST